MARNYGDDHAIINALMYIADVSKDIKDGKDRTVAFIERFEEHEARYKRVEAQNLEILANQREITTNQKMLIGICEQIKLSPGNTETVAKATVEHAKKDSTNVKIRRELLRLERKLGTIFTEYVHGDTPLFKKDGTSKHVQLTKTGEIVYNEVSVALKNFAKAIGANKEKFTNRGVYDKFFKSAKIQSYKRIPVTFPNRTTKQVLLATIIVNGHIGDYIKYVINEIKSEKAAIK